MDSNVLPLLMTTMIRYVNQHGESDRDSREKWKNGAVRVWSLAPRHSRVSSPSSSSSRTPGSCSHRLLLQTPKVSKRISSCVHLPCLSYIYTRDLCWFLIIFFINGMNLCYLGENNAMWKKAVQCGWVDAMLVKRDLYNLLTVGTIDAKRSLYSIVYTECFVWNRS